MKYNFLFVIAVLAFFPPVVQAQRVQSLPDEVKEIRIEGRQTLTVISGDENRIETNSDKDNLARVRNGRMTISSDAGDVTLRLAPQRSMIFRVEDYAMLEFNGSFAIRDNLTIETEDYAQAVFAGDTTDTVRAVNIVLRADDFSRITSDVILKHYNYELTSSDFSRIVLAGMDLMESSEANNWGEIILTAHINDRGKVYRGRMTAGGVQLKTDYPQDDDIASRVTIDATDRAVDLARNLATDNEKKNKSKFHSGDGGLVFAWGWHNWGDTPLSGISGVKGAANVNTSFNNIQFGGEWALIENRWIGLSAGLQLEWDVWKFSTPAVVFDATATPASFQSGAVTNGKTRLNVRYVEIPISFRVGDDDGVHLVLTALPGICWPGKGLRYNFDDAGYTVKMIDRSINKYLSPYKLDVRAALMFDWIGVYVQVSPLSAFGDGCQELFPVRFGIIL